MNTHPLRSRCTYAVLLLSSSLTALTLATSVAHAGDDKNLADKIARGKYIVATSGCHDCHTPWKMGPDGPGPDMDRMLSGHPEGMAVPPAPKPDGPWLVSVAATNTAWSGPWGVSFTANITPDKETGIGKWTLRNFRDMLRTGRHMGQGRPVLPPMPVPVYRNLTEADTEALFTYLQSIPPIRNRVPEPLPPAVPVAAN